MMLQRFYRSGAVFGAAMLMLTAAAMPAAAEIELEDGEFILETDDDDEAKTYECGDYTYSRMIASDGSDKKAACIEKYAGKEANLEIPAELDGLKVVSIGRKAFANADYLETVTLPATVTSLGVYAFVNCSALMDYNVETGNERYESKDGVLYSKDGKTLERFPLGRHPESYAVPEGITGIGDVAFATSMTLTEVTLPESLETLGTAAFSDCPRLLEVTIPSSVTEISDFAFNNCLHLKTVNLPETITEIGYAAFASTGLESFTIPAACTDIGEQAFAETKLVEIVIPNTVKAIGERAFGFKLDENGELHKVEGFVVGGELGTAAEAYARIGDAGSPFEFVNTGASEEELEDHAKRNSIIRIIGIIVCALLLLAIAVVAVITGKKKPKKQAEKSAEEKPADTESAEEAAAEEAEEAAAEPEETADTEEPDAEEDAADE